MRATVALLLALAAAGCAGGQVEEDSDQVVKARLESLLRGRTDLDMRYVTVDVHGRVATLSGLVPNREQQRLIDRLVKRSRGVDQVLNNLVIQD